MIPVGTAAQVRALDASVIDGLGLPGIALMELAADRVARAIVAHHRDAAERGVVVVCGGGNNGGDGWAVARRLFAWGIPVAVLPLKDPAPGDAAVMRRVAERLGVRIVEAVDGAGLVVDALFGTGLSREVQGRYADAIAAIGAWGGPVVAVDLPSGIHADTGRVLGIAVRAVRTVTFGWLKPGLLVSPGADHAGVVEIADIGLDAGTSERVGEVPEVVDLAPVWPRRRRGDHKGRSGHLLVVAGSEAMAGAAVLTCRGALAAGVGLVTLATPRSALARLGALPPEAMVAVWGEEALAPGVLPARITAVAAGPGLGTLPEQTVGWLRNLWRREARAVVFDADALPCAAAGGVGPRVITPHPGEAARRLGCSVADVEGDRFAAVRRLAKHGRVALLKGPATLVSDGNGPISVNPTGNPVLATAGAGDVLTGVIGALLARGIGARDAARLGAWVHGRAADHLAERRPAGWTAGDVADALPDAIAELLSG